MSEWHAVEALNDGIERTTKLLFKPFSMRLWLRLALVVFLLELSGSFTQITFRVGGDLSSLEDLGVHLTMQVVTLIIAAVAVLIFLSLVGQFVSAVFNFVFIEALFEEKVEFVENFRRNAGKGLSLFLFNLAVGIASLIIILAPLIAIIYASFKAQLSAAFATTIFLGMMVLWVLFVLAYMILASIFLSITGDFVVPLMHFTGGGVIENWRKAWSLLTKNLSQLMVYLVLKMAFGMISGIVELLVGLAALLVAIGVLLVLGGVGALAWLGLTALSPGLEGLTAAVIIAAFIALMAIALTVSYAIVFLTLPIPVFFRYYSILFLQRISPELNAHTGMRGKPAEKTNTPERTKAITEGGGEAREKTKKQEDIKAY